MGAFPAAGRVRRPLAMDIVRPRCAGVDIGKRTLTACVITTDPRGAPAKEI
jgi:hypothetical protein